MDDLCADFSIARSPLQPRGQARFDAVVEEAYRLLSEEGLAGFSIPALAERLGFTRASIYNFFPTHYAVLNELARRDLLALEERLTQRLSGLRVGWKERIRVTTEEAASFYDENPVARLLILGGSQTDESYRAQAVTVQHLGGLSKRMFAAGGITLPQSPVDVVELAIELATHCLRHSVFQHGRITPAYRDEAARMMTGYLEPYVRHTRKKPAKSAR